MNQAQVGGARAAGASPIEEQLEQRVAERTRELAALLDVSASLTATLELAPLLDLILDQLLRVLDYRTAGVFLAHDDILETVAARDTRGDARQYRYLGHRRPLAQVAPLWQRLGRGEVLVIGDVRRDDDPLAHAWRVATSSYQPELLSPPVRAWLAVPLAVRSEVVGYLALTREEPDSFRVRETELALAFANHAAVAVHNAQLYEAERRTAQELTSLLAVAHHLGATLDVEQLLDVILDQTRAVAAYDGASLLVIEGDTTRMLRRRAPTAVDPAHRAGSTTPLDRAGVIGELIQRREPIIIADVRADSPLAQAYRTLVGVPLETSHLRYVRAWLAVPMMAQDQVVGVIILARSEPGFYTARHAALVRAIATQAAAALENARLYAQAQQLAVLEERQRLARELHDSVSQVLFAIGLGARTTRTLLERQDAARALPAVEYITQLAEQGTAEMRALLFELRPESLAQEGLVAALTKQAAALRARHGLTVEAAFGEEPDVALAVKETLYRIAQEATHNTIKHAHARTVRLRLAAGPEGTALDIEDDGIGFDSTATFPGHLGLVSMRERVARLGGTLALESAPGQGTALRVRLPSGG